ncbi:MAG: hypothetical protein JWQ95_3036 [Sphaerisporangium sp.]|jgi:hypothetical protein|nr:hypothetical protein [Sphaerisporangium sp.]
MDDHLAGRWIAGPFRLLDFRLETDGPCAVVLIMTGHAGDPRRRLSPADRWPL